MTDARGFTLLEVLVALAILGVAVVASIQGFAQGLRLLKLAGDHQDAMMLADQKLREIVTPSEGNDDGTETRFRWRRTVTRVVQETAQTTPIPWTLYQVDVRVTWDEQREVHLATLRAVPASIIQTGTGTGTTPPGTTTPGTTQPGQSTTPPATGTPTPVPPATGPGPRP